MTWTNNINEDGLEVRFGQDRSAVQTTGNTSAEEKVLVFKIEDASTLGDTDTAAAAGDDAFIPSGAVIKDAYTIVGTAFAGATAVLDLGLKQADGTNIDDGGLDDAIAVGTLTADAVVAGDGALVGTKLSNDAYVMATYDTAAFTAGDATVVIKYILA